MSKKLTNAEFVEKALVVHGGVYGYSKTCYTNTKTKVCIICSIHGEFWMTPNSHLRGQGCKTCGLNRCAERKKEIAKSTFKTKSRVVHGGEYCYDKVEYMGVGKKVCIICPTHGEFWQTPGAHLRGDGCPACGRERTKIAVTSACRSKRPKHTAIHTPRGSKAVPLTKGYYALVDEEDYERVMEYNWHMCGGKQHKYARAYINGKGKLLHRLIVHPKKGMVVDHINGNGLDCRKSNMRVCTQEENTRNSVSMSQTSSVYKGVSLVKDKNRWVANIGYRGTKIHLGVFNTEIEAAKAYDEAAKKYHKDFARLNFQ